MSARLRITVEDYRRLADHLFPGDRDEHAAVLLAGVAASGASSVLLVREVHLLDTSEFGPGEHGYRQLAPSALARLGSRAEAEQLALISCHSHPGASQRVGLSGDDLAGHRRVFPHLLDIVANGRPVGGVAFGKHSAAGEIWFDRDTRTPLERIDVIGENHDVLRPSPPSHVGGAEHRFDRQALMFGVEGQRILRDMSVAVVGLGGGGSIISEHLAHLGVGRILAFDFDRIETHNLSRVVGARPGDARRRRKKVEVARRLARQVDRSVDFEAIDGDIADPAIAARLARCDFIFLCTDTITSRLIANAIAQAHLIPMVQIGAKIDRVGERIASVYVAVRPSFPRRGCLACAGMIDPAAVAREGAGPEERAAQNYLDLPEVVDPSVITLNSVAASVATNLMLLSAVGMAEPGQLSHRLFDARSGRWLELEAQRDPSCIWCGGEARSRFARGDAARLPVRTAPGTSGSRRRLRGLARRLRPAFNS
jgi:molybdopterin/thiamine biosynthesis adenylyltransferase